MIDREVAYERTISGSFMKIAAAANAKFDEKMMLKRKIKGILEVEQCFINGRAWYWYNISGKQSLDTYCRIQPMNAEMIKRIIISICDEVEILEFNLLDSKCLVLEPEYIFIKNINKEVIFTTYPGNREEVALQFQQLMEYLLAKIDHSDTEAVRTAYTLYEKSVDPAYNLKDLRDIFMEEKNEEARLDNITMQEQRTVSKKDAAVYQRTEGAGKAADDEAAEGKNCEAIFQNIIRIFSDWKKNLKKCVSQISLRGAEKEEEEEPLVIYPEKKEEIRQTIHPTICLTDYRSHPKGILLYEGTEEISNIEISGREARIGNSDKVEIRIPKDTISKFHAKIECEDENYYIEDLNSTNGTFVNDQELSYKERRKLEKEDIVKFADIRFRFI